MPLISKVSKGQVITAEKLNAMIDALNECRLTAVVGGQFSRGNGGTTITIQKARGGTPAQGVICPFDITLSPVTGGFIASFSAGTINGVLPTNIFTPLTNITTSANTYYYLKNTTDGKVITNCVLEKDTSLRTPAQPTADTAPTEFNIMIGYTTTAGVTEKTITCAHLQARIAPSIQEDADSYTAGERNYTQFYNWVF